MKKPPSNDNDPNAAPVYVVEDQRQFPPPGPRDPLFDDALVKLVEEFEKQSVPGAIGVIHVADQEAKVLIAGPAKFKAVVWLLYGEDRPDVVERLNSRPPEGQTWLLAKHRNGFVGLSTFSIEEVPPGDAA